MYWILKAIFGPLFRLMFHLEFYGQENIPEKGGYILVSNHRSGYDPLFLSVGSPKHVHYMAKQELIELPIIGWIIKKAGGFGVSRGTGDTGAVDTAVNYLKNGEIVGIFPEGTRSRTGKPLRPKSGVAHIAKMSGADILPCCVSINGKCRLGCTIKVRYGKLIPYEELGLDGEGSTGLRTATRTMWNQGVLPLLEQFEGPIEK
ncbi:MAG: 1-acyl-sn-glycerol-3-phosphate acyltransferase [Oscillospiraceae bacterium]|nr:1-acyl-sn-glycerol-3-phosphate acyltransferase [Oscillospiraceae bacterium]